MTQNPPREQEEPEYLLEGIWSSFRRGSIQEVLHDCLMNPEIMHERHEFMSWTPIHLAARFNKGEMVAFLLGKGVNIDVQDAHGQTPLALACFHGHFYMARLLLEHGANVNHMDFTGSTPLFQAVFGKKLRLVTLLREWGASASLKDQDGLIPVQWAHYLQDRPEIVTVLATFP